MEDVLLDPAGAAERARALRERALARFSQAAVSANLRIALAEIGLKP